MKKLTSLIFACALISAACAACENTEPKGQKQQQEEIGRSAIGETSEQTFYYSGGDKVYIEEVPCKVAVSFDEEHLSEIEKYLRQDGRILQMEPHGETMFILTTENLTAAALKKDLSKQTGIKSVNPAYGLAGSNGSDIYMTDEISVFFKESTTQEQIDDMHKKYGVEIIDRRFHSVYPKTRQILSVPIDLDPLEVANAYYESGLAESSMPNFVVNFAPGPEL